MYAPFLPGSLSLRNHSLATSMQAWLGAGNKIYIGYLDGGVGLDGMVEVVDGAAFASPGTWLHRDETRGRFDPMVPDPTTSNAYDLADRSAGVHRAIFP